MDDAHRPATQDRSTAGGRRRCASVARARELFLTSEQVEPGVVRDAILASWVRSREWHVSADPFELPYEPNPDLQSPLAHSAEPVIEDVSTRFADEPASIVLTDAEGVVLDRRVGDPALRAKLDRVRLAPGFSYAEQFAGTNGIGTALEGRGPAQVFGHEHYVEHLEDLACAGAPIHHPTTGKVLGIVDVTCWREDANPQMVATASALARQIEDSLLAHVGRRELALLQHYLAACRRNRGPVLAMSSDLVMMNDSARELIDPRDQVVLLGMAAEALSTGKTRVFTTSLPSGATARVHCRPSWDEPGTIGGVLQVHLVVPEAAARTGADEAAATSRTLPGAVGSSMQWTKCCQEVDQHFRSGEWLDLQGEAGVGKLAVARGTHLARTPAAHLRVLDAEECADPEHWVGEVAAELTRGTGTLVLRHVDRLPAAVLPALCEVVEAARDRPDAPLPWVVATRVGTGPVDEGLDQLVGCFPASVQVPPLRHHIEDIPEIVALLVARLTKGAALTCSPEAMRVLMRNRWPGNVTQLLGTLRKVVAHRRTGVIGLSDLPAECLAITRRVLTPLESIERDAVVESLISADGNRAEAARHLGMSRATIYRKIREYGISVPRRTSRSGG